MHVHVQLCARNQVFHNLLHWLASNTLRSGHHRKLTNSTLTTVVTYGRLHFTPITDFRMFSNDHFHQLPTAVHSSVHTFLNFQAHTSSQQFSRQVTTTVLLSSSSIHWQLHTLLSSLCSHGGYCGDRFTATLIETSRILPTAYCTSAQRQVGSKSSRLPSESLCSPLFPDTQTETFILWVLATLFTQ